MAYGLYDQAAELVQKALDAAPNRRDLKLKLLEVFFVWGNKDAFLSAAQSLRKEIGQKADPDWDKVVIMGKQICPDERLFAEATSAGGQVDVDLQAGDSPLDLAFDEAEEEGVDLDLGQSTRRELRSRGDRRKRRPRKPRRRSPVRRPLRRSRRQARRPPISTACSTSASAPRRVSNPRSTISTRKRTRRRPRRRTSPTVSR